MRRVRASILRSRVFLICRLSFLVTIAIFSAIHGIGSIAGEWGRQSGFYTASGYKHDVKGTYRADGYLERYSWSSDGTAGDYGGSSIVSGAVLCDTLSRWATECRATAEPAAASARGRVTWKHGLPSHGQGQCQGIYRARANVSLSFSATFAASGATASVVGGGSSSASCGVGAASNYGFSQLNIGCDTNAAKEYGFGVTGPEGVGVQFNSTQSQVGRYDSGPQLFPYLFSIDEAKTSFNDLSFLWQCDASLRLSGFARPGWMRSSRADGQFRIESKVSDVLLEVVDGPPGT